MHARRMLLFQERNRQRQQNVCQLVSRTLKKKKNTEIVAIIMQDILNKNFILFFCHSCPFPKCDEGKEYKGENAGDKNSMYPGCCATAICE